MRKDTKQNLMIFRQKTLNNLIYDFVRKMSFEEFQNKFYRKSRKIYEEKNLGKINICGQEVSCFKIRDSIVRGLDDRKEKSNEYFIVGQEFNVGQAINGKISV